MSMKYLGEQFDIHTGGVDLLPVHHVNEVAQSESATHKKPWVKYWLHGQMMLVQGQKMSKSLGNIYRLYDLEKEGFEPLALRYLYLQTHYRQEMNFTFPALEAAQNALNHLREEARRIFNFQFSPLRPGESRTWRGEAIYNENKENNKSEKNKPERNSADPTKFENRFMEAVNNDLNMPEALAVVWDMLKSDTEPQDKLKSLIFMDKVLGFDLENWLSENKKLTKFIVPDEVKELVEVREKLRIERRFNQADQIRNQILKLGYEIEDGKTGIEIRKVAPKDI